MHFRDIFTNQPSSFSFEFFPPKSEESARSLFANIAELQALNRKPMHMRDWIAKLDDFIRITDRQILTHAGKISHDTARLKAEAEYDTFRATQAALPQPVDQHFQDAIDELRTIESEMKKTPKRPKRQRRTDD